MYPCYVKLLSINRSPVDRYDESKVKQSTQVSLVLM